MFRTVAAKPDMLLEYRLLTAGADDSLLYAAGRLDDELALAHLAGWAPQDPTALDLPAALVALARHSQELAAWTARAGVALADAGERDGLELRYEGNRVLLELAAAESAATGDVKRADTWEALASSDRQILLFDETGRGLVVEVFGDLDDADHVAVVIPGMDTTVENFERFASDAARLHESASTHAPNTATIAWLGYATPSIANVASPDAAEAGVPALLSLWQSLDLDDPTRLTTVVAHSYGTVLLAEALASGAIVPDNVVFLASPGVPVERADALGLPPESDVWAARAPFDPAGYLSWFGPDPADECFGATRFSTDGAAGHSEYLDAGTESLDNIAAIVGGDEDGVSLMEPGLQDVLNALSDATQELLDATSLVDAFIDPSIDAAQRLVDLTGDLAADAASWAAGLFS